MRLASCVLTLLFPLAASPQSPPGEADLVRGKELFLRGDFDGARAALRSAAEALGDSRKRLDARLTLALIAQSQGDDERVLMELQWALVEDAGLELDSEVYSPKTRQAFSQAREKAFERLLQAKRDFAEGELDLALEEFRLAAELLERDVAEGQIENLLDAYLSSALIHQTLGDPGASGDRFRHALRLRPDLELDRDFYSPSTVEIFRSVKEEGARRLEEARAAIRASKLKEATDILASSDSGSTFFSPAQEAEAEVLGAYVRYLSDQQEEAAAELEALLRKRADVTLDGNFYGAEFVDLFTSLRIVVTRGLPGIAIVQSSEAVVHALAREGFEQVTVARYERFLLPGDGDRLREAARSGIDLIYALGDEALDLVLSCCADLPVVAANLSPNAPSLEGARASGSVLWNASVESQIPVALRALPRLARVGAIAGPGPGQALLSELSEGLAGHGVELVSATVAGPGDVKRALEDVLGKVDLFWYLPDPSLASVDVFETVRSACDENGTPIFAFHESLVRGGAFVGVSADFNQLGRRAGQMAIAYLSSRDPSTLQTVPGDASRVVVNLAAARRLGLEPDANLVSLAAAVYR